MYNNNHSNSDAPLSHSTQLLMLGQLLLINEVHWCSDGQ